MSKFVSVLLTFLILGIIAGCDSLPLIAPSNPTATPSRTPRPTFTPKPRITPTEIAELEPTEEPQPTEEPTFEPEPPTATPRPATRAPTRRPQPPPPTKPPEPTKPQFLVNPTSQYLCPQEGIFEVIVNAKKGRAFAGGLVFAAFDTAGNLLKNGAGQDMIAQTESAISISIGANCRVEATFENPNASNGKIDVGDAVRAGINPIIIRFVRSRSDLTPISPDIRIDFGKGGQYWLYAQSQ